MKPFPAILVFLSFALSQTAAQSTDSTKASFFRGQITATNNGISLVPNFSLGRPAALFDLSMGKGRFSFDPWLRFGLDTKPWVFIFWFRYKVIDKKKFNMGIGAHPSYLFKTELVTIGGVTREVTNTQRYFAWEATPTVQINSHVGLGIYYLEGHGLTSDLIQTTNFVAIRAIISKARLGQKFNCSITPQWYYLRQDQLSGTYANAVLGLAMNRFPVSLSVNLNWKLSGEIAGDDFLWGVGVVYNINNEYARTN